MAHNPYLCRACGVDFSQGRDTGYCNHGPGCLNPDYADTGDLFDDGDSDIDSGCDLCGQDFGACQCTAVELDEYWRHQ